MYNRRARHIKCDEGKPHCRRCLTSATVSVCGGYDPSSASKKSQRTVVKSVKLLPRLSNLPPNACWPTIQVSVDAEERRYFYLFRQNVAEVLSGHFHSEFWLRLIPQTVHESAPILHAVVAVSALSKCLETSSRSPLRIDAQRQRDSQYQYAILQYSKAISSLRHLLRTKGSHYRVTLITVCNETCR